MIVPIESVTEADKIPGKNGNFDITEVLPRTEGILLTFQRRGGFEHMEFVRHGESIQVLRD